MAKFNYARARNTANKLIDKFGATGSLLRYQAPADRSSRATYTPEPIKLVVIDYNAREVDGTRILATDKKILISPIGINGGINLEDRIMDAAGATYEIVPPINTVDPPGSAIVLFEVQGRI